MLNAEEIATGYTHGTYEEFCERVGADKLGIPWAETMRKTALPDGLFKAYSTAPRTKSARPTHFKNQKGKQAC